MSLHLCNAHWIWIYNLTWNHCFYLLSVAVIIIIIINVHLYFCSKLVILIAGWVWNARFFWWKWTTPIPYIIQSTIQKFWILLYWVFHWPEQRTAGGKKKGVTDYSVNISVILMAGLNRVMSAAWLFMPLTKILVRIIFQHSPLASPNTFHILPQASQCYLIFLGGWEWSHFFDFTTI